MEAGFADSDYVTWFGIFVPAKTPRDIVEILHRETLKALQKSKMQEKLATLGVGPMIMTSAEFNAYVKREIDINAALFKAAGIKPN